MREITAQEFVKTVGGKGWKVESEDTYGLQVSMYEVIFIYDLDYDELTFKSGLSEIRFNVHDCIESIIVNDDDTYTIIYNQYMSDVLVSKVQSIIKDH